MGLFKPSKEKQLIALQNFLMNRTSKSLEYTPKQILNSAASYINARNKVIESADKQLNQTDNPRKFFEYVEKVNKAIAEIDALEKVAPGTTNFKPGAMQKKFNKTLPDGIDEMIDRCWKSYQLQAAKLAKDDSKQKKMLSFFDAMELYKEQMFPQNLKRLDKLKKSIKT